MFSRYYQEELSNLRDLGREFCGKHPALAPYLGGPSADPDVERLLEGVAFLSGLLRQKIDDEFPEIIHQLMELIWPHYLRPIPSSAIVSFSPKPGLQGMLSIPAGTGIASVPIDGTSCIFRTCQDVDVQPCKLLDADYRERPGQPLELRLLIEMEGMNLAEWPARQLRFFLAGEYASACDLYCLLCEDIAEVRLHPLDGGRDFLLPASSMEPIGFSDEEALLPYPANSFPGYRIIQEYFINPQKFLFIALNGIEKWSDRGEGTRFEIILQLNRDRNEHLPPVDNRSFALSAVPVINIFTGNAEPIRLDHHRFRYPVRASASNPEHYQIYSVERVTGFIQGSAVEREYVPFVLFGSQRQGGPFYSITRQPGISGMGMDIYLSVAYPDASDIAPIETLSLELLCTNGFLPEQLQVGDLCMSTSTTPELVEFKNLTLMSPCSLPTLGQDLLWRLISHLNLNYSSLASAENLKSLLKLYVFSEARNKKLSAVNLRRIQGIEGLDCKPADRMVSGLVFRGLDILLNARQDHFASRGDLYLFGSVIERFLGSYAALNAFVQMTLQESFTGEQFRWAPRIGDRHLL